MAHLVGSFVALGDEYKSLEVCYAEIREAQEYPAVNGADAFAGPQPSETLSDRE